MKNCPNCGQKMNQDSLYCENCGEDIHIVPDYTEDAIDLKDEVQNIMGLSEERSSVRRIGRKHKTKNKKATQAIALLLSGIVLALIVLFSSFVYQIYKMRNSVNFQLSQAEKYVSEQDFERAATYFERAAKLAPEDISILIKLSDVYLNRGMKVQYESLLRDIIANENTDTAQLIAVYGKLIGIYRSREDFKAINDILSFSKNEEVLKTYKEYLAPAPTFSLQEGYYTDKQPLSITGEGKSTIYYTLDGSIPDQSAMRYTTPIVLESGDYEVQAISYNSYGIGSEIKKVSYHIELSNIPAPQINIISGEYHTPVDIEVLGDTQGVFYTTDRSMPSISSKAYQGPIRMQLGTTIYKFVQIKDDRVSEISELTVTLTLNTDLSELAAEQVVFDYEIAIGRITDVYGHYDGSLAKLKYQYQYVISIEDAGEFYVIEENRIENETAVTKTGNMFAVNVYNGIIYKLQIDEFNNYNLVDM